MHTQGYEEGNAFCEMKFADVAFMGVERAGHILGGGENLQDTK